MSTRVQADSESTFWRQFPRLRHRFSAADGSERSYLFPTFFESRVGMAAFFCALPRLRDVLPKALKPVSMLGERGVIVIGCYDHLRVAEMAPYREAFVLVPTVVHGKLSPPILPLAWSRLRHDVAQFFLAMPVSEPENCMRGVELWGFPKTVASIECTADDHSYRCSVNRSGRLAFELSIPTRGTPLAVRERLMLVGQLDGSLVRAHSEVEAEYAVQRYPLRGLGVASRRPPELRLGGSPLGDLLRSLEVETAAFETRYAARSRSALQLPDGLLVGHALEPRRLDSPALRRGECRLELGPMGIDAFGTSYIERNPQTTGFSCE
jgi:hypothetical protein